MKKLIISLCILASYILISVFTVFTCSVSGYKQVTVNNKLANYSLEYPSLYYENIIDELDFKVPFMELELLGPFVTEEAEVFDPDTGKITKVKGERIAQSIVVHISNYKIYYGDSYSAADRIESVLEDKAKWENFQLLERSPLAISGVEGELVVYLVDRLMPIPVEDGKNLEYIRAAYFDYNDFTWSIVARCKQEIKDQVISDFNHVIQSFKILD